MSLLESFAKKKKLNAALAKTAKARNSKDTIADHLYEGAYQDYAEVLIGDSIRSEALYNWGFALLHQAKTKTEVDATNLYQEAIVKFSFCLLLNPDYLGAAIDGGVAYMDLARLIAVDFDDDLYEAALVYFERANAIQAGSASYNLACIYGLRDEDDACLAALEESKNKGSLPSVDDIVNDPDLTNVKNKPWFIKFLATLNETSAAAVVAYNTGLPSGGIEKSEPQIVDSADVTADVDETVLKTE